MFLLSESGSSLGADLSVDYGVSFPNVSVSNVIENSSYDLPYVKNFNTRNDSSSLIKDYKCNKIKSTKLKLSIVREKCSDIVLCKKANGAMKTSSVEFISRSPNPLPMKSKHHRFVLLEKSSSLGSGSEGKREIVLNRRPELYRGKYRCVQPKINLFSSGLHGNTAADSVRSEWPLWHAAKIKAVFACRRSKSKPEQKLLDIRAEKKENAREERPTSWTPCCLPHETVSLGANRTKVLGLSWNTNKDYLTTDTKSLLEFVSLDKNTKRFILQAVGKIFDPLGLISPFTVRMKCLLQVLWKEEIQWDDPLPTHIEKEWKKWCEELPHLRNLKIPRLVLDSTLLEDDVELHSFCDASKKAYGAAIYLRTKSRNGISVKLVTSKSRVASLNCVTLPKLELLGALVAACLASKQVVPELDYLTEHEKETVVQERKKLPEADRSEETVLLNSDSSSILDELLELSNNYFEVINILSYIFRFNYNCRNKSKKVGPLTVAEFKESEIKLIKHAQRSLFDKKRNSKLYF
ncbi:DUF1758 domain-containing protein [Trichonephila clavipes]|nr:DUF1758 domain-containing protein [Trichonephila clavipes]